MKTKECSLIAFALFFSLSVFAADVRNIDITGPLVVLDDINKEEGKLVTEVITLRRHSYSPDRVMVGFNFEQTEMICLERIPDGGGDGFYRSSCRRIGPNGRRCFGRFYDGYDRNPYGLCSKWDEIFTNHSRHIIIDFSKAAKIKETPTTYQLYIRQKSVGSTTLYVDLFYSGEGQKERIVKLPIVNDGQRTYEMKVIAPVALRY